MLEDYTRMVTVDPDNIERTALTGSLVASIIANRVSWYFDLHGPSIHVNTACSSSLAAVDIACKAIQSGDAECVSVTPILLGQRYTPRAKQLHLKGARY